MGSGSGDVSMTSSSDVAVCEWSTGIAQVAATSELGRSGMLTGRQVDVTWAGRGAGVGRRFNKAVSGFSRNALYTVAVLSEGALRESRG